ncbi:MULTISPECIES: M20/M25/M40 family metallo-hydrolase [unclassified Arcicella]|uniref:M20/M25/M40 family metallo-hydrolase n=1 Tax=unclassified Arcicella TaxID=2644986 RepID=UPI0028630C73|nr:MULTISPECIES: M20/M25/M40 family metallo-hydrolase [unclassified Arcicella]MDR6563165.1 glutamate carboxypeptidase [Arcicella sp. BE51]MDR6811684.1 glutamate carboxypeptidase [Arcicella sp. BE140]MDR6823209.1 glutamate carboxypeptidase [Arcicella sp. BE139]
MKKIVLTIGLLALFGHFSNGQQLNKTEKKIAEYIEEQMPQTEALLKKIVNINSGTLNKEGVKEVGNILRKEFDDLGFKTEWISLPDSLNRAGHLVAERKGKTGKKLFLIGHLDTVFEKAMTFTPYTYLNDSIVTGQGVNDMKGGDIVLLAALKALHQHGLLENTTLTAYFTGDEESAGRPTSISRKDFIERAQTNDIALAFETAVNLNTVATARRGSSGWKLNVKGVMGHSSTIFSQQSGYGAIYEAARILNEFREKLSTEKYLTFNPGLIMGGSEINDNKETIGKDNIISPRVMVSGDLRFLSESQKENARVKMKEIVSHSLNKTKAEITFSDGIPAMEPTPANENLLAVINKVSLDLGLGEVKAGDPGSRGAGDISYIAKYMACLDGLGASGKGAHAPGETMNMKEFPKLVQRTAILIYRLTR